MIALTGIPSAERSHAIGDGGRSGCYIGRLAKGCQRGAQGCREDVARVSAAHSGHGGVCRNWAAWRATRGGCGDRISNPVAYGILTETQSGAGISILE